MRIEKISEKIAWLQANTTDFFSQMSTDAGLVLCVLEVSHSGDRFQCKARGRTMQEAARRAMMKMYSSLQLKEDKCC